MDIVEKMIWVAVIFSLVLGLFIGIMVCSVSQEPQGIGGFVYQEIEWQDQTINVMQKNCDSGLFLDGWSRPGYVRLYCWVDECKGDYCKRIEWFSPVWTPLDD